MAARRKDKDAAAPLRPARARRSPSARVHCRHHWIIEPPNGPKSVGRCRRCGRRERFPNSSDYDVTTGVIPFGDGRLSADRLPLFRSVLREG